MTASRLRALIGAAALLGFVAVAAGAFGAHGVSDPRPKAWLQTGAQYGMIHALACLAAAAVARLGGGRTASAAAFCFLAGGAIFSGTLYGLALTGALWLGAITPIGGVLILAGWALLAWAGFRLTVAD